MDDNQIRNYELIMLAICIFSCKVFFQNVELMQRQHHFQMVALSHTVIVQQ